MMSLPISLVETVQSIVQGDPFWEGYLRHVVTLSTAQCSFHLAILVEPYLQFILEGRKTVESRFSMRRCAPYECVQRGDIVFLKRSSGPIVGLCQIADAWFYRLDPDSWNMIRKEFTQALCAQDPDFWQVRRHATFATLMRLQHVRTLSPLSYTKRDRRGWVILQRRAATLPLWGAQQPLVLAFAGRIASGKSTLSAGVAQVLGWPRVSFGDYVRQVARHRGLKESRTVLQELGAALIAQGWETFCNTVLGQAAWKPGQPLIIDGIRHAEALAVLRQLVTPSELRLVFITVDEPTRTTRLRQRESPDGETMQRIEEHTTEAQVGTVLPGIADFLVDGTRPQEELQQDIVRWVQQQIAYQ
jgi:dephospho-CoA kinase